MQTSEQVHTLQPTAFRIDTEQNLLYLELSEHEQKSALQTQQQQAAMFQKQTLQVNLTSSTKLKIGAIDTSCSWLAENLQEAQAINSLALFFIESVDTDRLKIALVEVNHLPSQLTGSKSANTLYEQQLSILQLNNKILGEDFFK